MRKVATFRAFSIAASERGTFNSAAVPVAPTPGGKPYRSTASLRSCNEGQRADLVCPFWLTDCYTGARVLVPASNQFSS